MMVNHKDEVSYWEHGLFLTQTIFFHSFIH
ncbi:hypothetical protein CH64_152 [Yersinia rohdei]|uniref:Uncharacterized protein n=1 Tax=Yersinia rohdei TaxID=29485 RepID=A0A0U1HS32_YERRO|nr:hypothetical protein CH64_152 [Yersinia rohdei]CNI94446.1 Uncharacterised protein [Yersinia rohdei]CQI89719.1 Uncharacterised protein [Yersinia rohdei]